ncbi:MAG TPA: hypothetical protein DD729_03535 [Rhodobacteraceae bacterium]|nr:hypothetical protein [Paracoccaceae bacterium]
MRCKREVEPNWWVKRLYDLFNVVSGYGSSIGRPAFWLFVLWIPAAIGKVKPQENWWPVWDTIIPAMAWSFGNLTPFFGFYRRYFKDETVIDSLLFYSGVQTVSGFILVFLLGLGIRNRFRLR